jgi:penicillin-insensitive murein DD-endopeptidase
VKRALGLGLLLTSGCIGAPTPLAPNRSGSVGVPHAGVLTNGVELPVRGKGFVRLRPKSPHYWGNPRMIAAIEAAAARVGDELPGGAPLYIGDISAKGGGQIPGHHSHRTGRDADLLFYAATPSGAPEPSPGFVKFGSDGLAALGADTVYVRLDVERQWRLVKALLEDRDALVEWMFVSRDVEALLIDYARSRGEDPYLVWHAETMLLQPGDSSPHDDHMHLRIACSPEEELAGCEGGGPHWEWLPASPSLGDLGAAALENISRDDPFDVSEPEAAERHAGGDV